MREEKEIRFPKIMNIINRIRAAYYCLFGKDVICFRIFRRRNASKNVMNMTAYVFSDDIIIDGTAETLAQEVINLMKRKEE